MVGFEMTESSETLHPGRILLLQAMEPLGISRNQLARDIDVPVGRISDITNGKRGITADTALRLGRYFGTGPELWLRLQAEFDLYVARMTTWPAVETRVRILTPQTPGETPPAEFASAPVTGPVAVPEDDEPLYDASEVAEEPVTAPESIPETGSEPFDAGSDEVPDEEPDTAPVSVFGAAETPAQPEFPGEVPDSSEEPDLYRESEDEPQAVPADPETRDETIDPERDPDLHSDVDEDLGIPPIPDKSKMFMSG